MKNKTYIFFDLDGTLTDPKEGITKSVQYALNHYGIQVASLEELTPFIGPPLAEAFARHYGFAPEKARAAVGVFREYFTAKGMFQNKVLPGIPKLLAALKENGKKLYVATSKPELFARQILDRYQLSGYFEFIGGADFAETRVRKGDVIAYVLEQTGLGHKKDEIVMVGDREHDILGAKEHGIDSIGFLLGYGSREELAAAGAGEIVRDATELEGLLIDSQAK